MFWDVFYKCCINQNTKPNPVGSKLGFSSGVITKWKNGGVPSGEALIKIANYFNVSVDYLLGRTNYPNITIEPDIILYNKLDTEDKAEIRGTMKQMLKSKKYKPSEYSVEPALEIAAYGADGTEGEFITPPEDIT